MASRHAGMIIVCPHCQAKAAAVPDTQPRVVPSPSQNLRRNLDGNPATTTRVARPLDPTTTATIRRERAVERFGTELLPPPRAAPGMAGFADGRPPAQPVSTTITRRTSAPTTSAAPTGSAPTTASPGTAAITRNNTARQVAPPPPQTSQVPFIWAASAAAVMTAVAIFGYMEASTHKTRWQLAKQQADEAKTAVTHVQTTADALDKRLAQAQVELIAARSATLREREIVTDLQKTTARLAEELVKRLQPSDAPFLTTTPAPGTVAAMVATGAFPAAVSPSAGVPTRQNNR